MTAPTVNQPDTWADVEAARDGDRDAFALIWQAHHRRVLAYIRSRVESHATAEDLTSETFVRALTHIDTFEWRGRDIGAWLTTIARNLVADHHKSSRMRTTALYADVLALDGPDPVDVAKIATDPPVFTALWHAVSTLPPNQRECIHLRYGLGLNVAETCAATGWTTGMVKALSHRAYLGLRRRLDPVGLAKVTP